MKETGLDGEFPLKQAIADLPRVRPDSGEFVVSEVSDNGRIRLIFNHVARYHNEDDLRIIRALRQGEKYATLVERRPDVLQGRTHKTYSTENFPDKYFRLSGDSPSRTIVAHLSKDGNGFIHPEQDRALTVREAARIQTFPDDFIFIESRSTQFVGIGNAVPPALARVFARFFRTLEGDK